MRLHQTALTGEPRLRVVFASKSVALGLPTGSTLGDIAEWIGDRARRHNGALQSVDIKMAMRRGAELVEAH